MPKHRSVSQMSTYTSCPRKYKFSYLDDVDIIKGGSALSLGSALHKAQEFNYRQKIKSQQDLPLIDIEEYMTEFLIKEFQNNQKNPNFFKVKYGRHETGEAILNTAKGLLRKLYSEVMVKTQPVYVELPITLNILGQEFMQYIDLVDDKEIVRDLKTSASKFSEDVLDFNTQLIAYALGYRTKFGKKEKGVQLDVLIKTKVPQIQIIKSGPISDSQIERFLNSLEQINKAIEQEIFPPVDNQMTCGWCDFKELCHKDGGLPDAEEFAKKLLQIEEVKKDN